MPGDVRMLRDERFRRYWRSERATCGRGNGGIAGATLAEIQRMVKGAVSREAFGRRIRWRRFGRRIREAAAVRGHKELA